MPRRRKDKVDANQNEIVSQLRKMGMSVEVGHDDILVGYAGMTFWFEIKVSDKAEIKPDQKRLAQEFKGHYQIVWSLDMILESINGAINNAKG